MLTFEHKENQNVTVTIEANESQWYEPAEPTVTLDGKPYFDSGRVITCVPTKEFQVIYATQHENKDLQSIFEEFKMFDDKVLWLRENRNKLNNYNINVDNLIEKWSEDQE